MEDHDLLTITTDIVTAYVGQNSIRAAELPEMIAAVHAAVTSIARPTPVIEAPTPKPAVPIKTSVTEEYIISLEDGRKLKTLTRHLKSLGMTPDQYRAKWGLPSSYPMVAPQFTAQRAQMAKHFKLGKSHRLKLNS